MTDQHENSIDENTNRPLFIKKQLPPISSNRMSNMFKGTDSLREASFLPPIVMPRQEQFVLPGKIDSPVSFDNNGGQKSEPRPNSGCPLYEYQNQEIDERLYLNSQRKGPQISVEQEESESESSMHRLNRKKKQVSDQVKNFNTQQQANINCVTPTELAKYQSGTKKLNMEAETRSMIVVTPVQDKLIQAVNESTNLQFKESVFLIENEEYDGIRKNHSIFTDFTELYAANKSGQNQKCIIYQNNRYKIIFDVYILFLMLFTTAVIPYRMAFVEQEVQEWIITYQWLNFSFLIDLVLNFFTTYTDFRQQEITTHKLIVWNYCKSWLLVDLISVIPFDLLDNGDTASALSRFARLGKLWRMIRLIRLVKILKLIKSNKRLVHKFSEKMRIDSGTERLAFFSFFFIIFLHVSGCLFVFVNNIAEDYVEARWLDKFIDYGPFNTYILSVYFVLTTTATVGYGDVQPANTYERIFCMLLMMIGVMSFTFISGALSSILSSYDTKQASLSQKVLQLNKLRLFYTVPEPLYQDIRQALDFDSTQQDSYLDELYRDLPIALRNQLMLCVHDTALSKFGFFKNLGNKYYVTWVSSQLKPRVAIPGQRLYQELDEIDDFYFMTKGVAAFITPAEPLQYIGLIDPGKIMNLKKRTGSMSEFQYFGCEDSVYNHLLMLIEVQNGKSTELQKKGENALNQRRFSVECLSTSEYLTLHISHLDKMKKNFQAPSRKFYKNQIAQLKQLLCYKYYTQRFKLNDITLDSKLGKVNYLKQTANKLNQFVACWKTAVHEKGAEYLEEDLIWSSSDDECVNVINKKETQPLIENSDQDIDQGSYSQQFYQSEQNLEKPKRSSFKKKKYQVKNEKVDSQSEPGFVLQASGNRQFAASPQKTEINRRQNKIKLQRQNSQAPISARSKQFNRSFATSQKSSQVDHIQTLKELLDGLSGFKALATVLDYAKKYSSKKNMQNNFMDALIQKIVEKATELDLIKQLTNFKVVILENLLAEQDFRIYLNSIDSSERALKQFCENQTQLVQVMSTNMSMQMDQLGYQIEQVNSRLNQIEKKIEFSNQ